MTGISGLSHVRGSVAPDHQGNYELLIRSSNLEEMMAKRKQVRIQPSRLAISQSLDETFDVDDLQLGDNPIPEKF